MDKARVTKLTRDGMGTRGGVTAIDWSDERRHQRADDERHASGEMTRVHDFE